jgi:pyrroloquinoline quinone biosynthesis protein B
VLVTADGSRFVLINASPDVRLQMERTRELHPRSARGTPVRAIVLTNADVDHVLGLLSLRESEPLVVWATPRVRAAVEANALVRVLMRTEAQLTWRALTLDMDHDVEGLAVRAFACPGKPPAYLPQEPRLPEDNVGLLVAAGGRSMAYVTAAAGPGGYLETIAQCDRVLFDGTFWSDDELIRGGLGRGRAGDMAHWPIGGEQGSLKGLQVFRGRLAYTHVNNTNPILLESSERRAVESAGFAVAYDGMTFEP